MQRNPIDRGTEYTSACSRQNRKPATKAKATNGGIQETWHEKENEKGMNGAFAIILQRADEHRVQLEASAAAQETRPNAGPFAQHETSCKRKN